MTAILAHLFVTAYWALTAPLSGALEPDLAPTYPVCYDYTGE